MNRERLNLCCRLARLGFSPDEVASLIRCAGRLHRWAERTANGEIEEIDGRYHRVSYSRFGDRFVLNAVPNHETASIRRAAEIVEARNGRCADLLDVFHQTDPRGAPLYLVPVGTANVAACYSSIGTAVFS